MHIGKNLIPLAFRDRLRPLYQWLYLRWSESRWSPKPKEWRLVREDALTAVALDRLLEIARAEFGITQKHGEITGLLRRLRMIEPQTVVEIGTHKGGNSFLFCHALPSVKLVVGVDLCVQNAPKLIYFERPGQVYYALHGDSQTSSMLCNVKKRLNGQSVDFLFIDGDHSLNGVFADFQLYAPLVRPGGIVAFHDIVPDHRTRYGGETACYAGEVFQLWQKLKQVYDCEELIDHPGQDGFGIGLITIPAGGLRSRQYF